MKPKNQVNSGDREGYLQSVLSNLPSQEIEDYILNEEADMYLSSLEAHEQLY